MGGKGCREGDVMDAAYGREGLMDGDGRQGEDGRKMGGTVRGIVERQYKEETFVVILMVKFVRVSRERGSWATGREGRWRPLCGRRGEVGEGGHGGVSRGCNRKIYEGKRTKKVWSSFV